MQKYRIVKDGRHVGDIEADDARQAGPKAVEQWGDGMYDISLVREAEPEDRQCVVCGDIFRPGPGESENVCEDCIEDDEEAE